MHHALRRDCRLLLELIPAWYLCSREPEPVPPATFSRVWIWPEERDSVQVTCNWGPCELIQQEDTWCMCWLAFSENPSWLNGGQWVNWVQVGCKVSPGVCFLSRQQFALGVYVLSFWHPDAVIARIHFLSVDRFVTWRTASSIFSSPARVLPVWLQPHLPLLPTHALSRSISLGCGKLRIHKSHSFPHTKHIPTHPQSGMISWVNHAIIWLFIGAAFRQRFWCQLHEDPLIVLPVMLDRSRPQSTSPWWRGSRTLTPPAAVSWLCWFLLVVSWGSVALCFDTGRKAWWWGPVPEDTMGHLTLRWILILSMCSRGSIMSSLKLIHRWHSLNPAFKLCLLCSHLSLFPPPLPLFWTT